MQIRVIDRQKNYVKGGFVNVINFGQTPKIDFRSQINGKGRELIELGRYCEKLGGVSLVGAESDNCGIKRKSVFVFKGSSLISICDMNAFEEKYNLACGYKIIEFGTKKIGVLVDRDIFSPTAVHSLSLCGVSAIIDLYAGFLARKAQVACEFYSYVYGVDILCVCQNESCCFSAVGDEIMKDNDGFFTVKGEGVFSDVKIKRRGKGV